MDVKIRIVTKRKIRRDNRIKDFPCIVKITGKHNHSTKSAEALGQLRVSSSTRNSFSKYFEQGMTTAQTARHHAMKMNLIDSLDGPNNSCTNPSSRTIDYMRRIWLHDNQGGFNDVSTIDSIKKYAMDNPNLTIEIEEYEANFCVALVTPFMKRVHTEFREACEVVFVDATGCVKQFNTAVLPLLCASPAGVAPLAILFASAQDEALLTNGFNLVKKAIGSVAFYGKGSPQCFMTDDCDATRKALAATWPEAKQFLSISFVLQKVWKWLLDSQHSVRKEHCQELIGVIKKLAYASCTEEFNLILVDFQCSSLTETYPDFKSYVHALVERKEEWAVCYRVGTMLQGHHTNHFCESTICIMKHIVHDRCKAYNTAQLLVFIAEIFNEYLKQRLVDVALGRRRMKTAAIFSKIPAAMVTPVGSTVYEVQSQSIQGQYYSVDLTVGMCTCTMGEKGVHCKHQVAAAEHSMLAVPQMVPLTANNRRWLAGVALGLDDVPSESSFEGLQDGHAVDESRDPEQVKALISEEQQNVSHNSAQSPPSQPPSPCIKDMPTQPPSPCMEDIPTTYEEQDMSLSHPSLQARSLSHARTQISDSSQVAEIFSILVKKLGNEETKEALKKVQKILSSIKTTERLNSFLHRIISEQR